MEALAPRAALEDCASGSGAPILEMRQIAKSFGAVAALKDVSLTLRAGTVHTLLGENGAGKSTLMKILAGVHQPGAGQILLNGKPVRFEGPSHSRALGISIIYQELSLAKNLSVADNLFANHPPRRAAVIDDRTMLAQSRALLADLQIPIDAATPVGQLSIAQRQLVEIAKALNFPSRVVIMDEPTSSLSDSEAEILFAIIGRLKAQGKAVVYISHRMEEIMRISDEISVLRDGQSIGTHRRAHTSIEALIAQMVGREMREVFPPRAEPCLRPAAARLEVRRLSQRGRFSDISFKLHAGEVLGFFGLIGAGRSELMDTLFGIQPGDEGQVLLDGEPVQLRSPGDAIEQGIAFVTENRREQGLVLSQSIVQNITMVQVHRGRRGAWLTREREELHLAQAFVKRLGIKIASLHQAAGELSGGNQQKIVFAKWLAMQPRILILDEPTRGVDVGAKYEIYSVIRELAAAGTAVILVSSELPEVLAMSDRLMVMRNKQLIHQFDSTAGLSQQAVMSYATGALNS